MAHHKGTNPRTGHWTACLCPVKDVPNVAVEPPQENRERGKGEFSFCRPVALPRRNSRLRRCPARPLPISLGALSWGSLATSHSGHHPKNWLSGTPLYSPLYSQGRCLRRAHCGSLRAGAGAARDLGLRAGRLPRWVRACVHVRDLHSVSLPLLLSVSSRVLQHMVYLSVTFMRYFPCFCEATSPFLLLDTHVSFIIQPACTQLSTRPRMFLFIVGSFVCTRYSVTNMK